MNHCNFAFCIVIHFCSNEIRISVNKVKKKILKIFCCTTRIRITEHFLGSFLVRITILSDSSC